MSLRPSQPAQSRPFSTRGIAPYKSLCQLFLITLCGCGFQAKPGVQLSLSGPSEVRLGATAQYSTALSAGPGAIIWAVDGSTGGSIATGPISAAGLYSPADAVSAGSSVTISAIPESSPSLSASLSVAVLNQLPTISFASLVPGANAGSYLLSIRGTGFVSKSQVWIGSTNVSVAYVSSKELQGTISLPAGTTSVTVGVLNPNAGQAAPVTTVISVPQAQTTSALIASSTSISFGAVTENTSVTQSVTLTATGNVPVNILSGTLTGAGFTMSAQAFPVTLNPNQTLTLSLHFDPLKTGSATGQLVIQSNSSTNGTVSINLSGTGSSPFNAYWVAPPVGSDNSLGTVMLSTGSQQKLPVLNPTITGTVAGLVCAGASWNSTNTTLTITYAMGSTTIHVVVVVTPNASGFTAQIDADQSLIAFVDFGNWSSSLNPKGITIPYYSSQVWYAPALPGYLNAWWDFHATQATWLNGTAARYLAKTDGTFNRLHEVMQFAASPVLDTVLPVIGNSPSPYMSTMSGRTVLDIWDQGFSQIQEGLADLGDYGISNCIAVIHNWQYAGYDNALPEQYPANSSLGGGGALQAAIAQGKANGCLMAVHENYLDYFPNYPEFNRSAIALNSDGSEILGWLNPSTGIQSYAAKSSLMVANAQTQSPTIHSSYGTTADYIDVNSAALPSSYDDMDASSPRAGYETAWIQNSQALWAYERSTHNGPVLGEGAIHWYYSGFLDGVEAQLGAGATAINSDAFLPLFVDFDLLSIHPLQVNHGMGYYDRWTQSGTWAMTTAQLDAYRMQEIAFGHAPYLTTGVWNNIPLALVESGLVSPVATSYGTAHATSIQYMVNGAWVSSSVAALAESFEQVQELYDNGLTVVANANNAPLSWKSLTIPQDGWAAQSPNILAYTAQCGSTICDYAQTATSLFANSRNQSDIRAGSGYAAPSVTAVKQGSGRSFTITYNWQVYRLLGTNSYAPFVQFVEDSQASDANSGIVFQGGYQFNPPTPLWQAGQTVTQGPVTVPIPSSVADGTYSIRVGIYDQVTGNRLPLVGNNDGTGRYIVGNLTISGGGSQISFAAPTPPANDPRLNATGSVVDFGTVQTDGMISITQNNGQWVLRPFPRGRNFTVLLNTVNFPVPTVVQTGGGGSSATVTPALQGSMWRLPLDGSTTYTWPIH